MSPVFIFGTGRCGSTHVQRMITLSTCCWIWGEHEGFLEPLLEAVHRRHGSGMLEETVSNTSLSNDDQLISEMVIGSKSISWLNRLDKSEFQNEIALLIDRLFRPGIPNGWTEWGFKEIRYGLDNHAPGALLELFPSATALFTFRNPKRTIESMIRAWGTPGLLDGPESLDGLRTNYENAANIWTRVMRYFIENRENVGKRIRFVSDDKLNLPVDQFLNAIGLPAARDVSAELGVTNAGLGKWPSWANREFEVLFEKDQSACVDLFARACAASDADFGPYALSMKSVAGS